MLTNDDVKCREFAAAMASGVEPLDTVGSEISALAREHPDARL
jgi:hypothetical protein